MHAPAAAAPSAAAVSAFRALYDKGQALSSQSRHQRAAENLAKAADAARSLWSSSSLCVVWPLLDEAVQLLDQARVTGAIGAAPFVARAEELLAECRATLRERLAASALLPGSCRDEEEDFEQYAALKVVEVVHGRPPTKLEASVVASRKSEVGFAALCVAAKLSLDVLYTDAAGLGGVASPLAGDARDDAHAFVLLSLGACADAGHSGHSASGEHMFASAVQRLLESDLLEAPFKEALTQAWGGVDLRSALLSRRVFDGDNGTTEAAEELAARLEAKAAADVAKHGYRSCALPSCGRREASVFEFKTCGACEAVVYCSRQHAAAHWPAGHKQVCKELKAAGAKPPSTAAQ